MSIVYLLGMRGVGKSALGKIAAKNLGVSFVDMDQVLEDRLQQSTVAFIVLQGEAAFREQEAKLLQELEEKIRAGKLAHALIATGGGIVEGEESRHLLHASTGKKLLLEAPLELLWQRLAMDADRTRVGNLASFADFQSLYERRKMHFSTLCSHKIFLSGESTKDSLSIENYYRKH